MYSCKNCSWTGNTPDHSPDKDLLSNRKPGREVEGQNMVFCPQCGSSIVFNENTKHNVSVFLTNNLADFLGSIGVPLILLGLWSLIPPLTVLSQSIFLSISLLLLVVGLIFIQRYDGRQFKGILGIRLLIMGGSGVSIIIFNTLIEQLIRQMEVIVRSIDMSLILVGTAQVFFAISLTIYTYRKKKR